MLEKTKLNSNTQKVEATNRTLRRSLPKNVNFNHASYARAHSDTHSSDNCPGESIFKLCNSVGAGIKAGTKAAMSLAPYTEAI